MLRYRVAVWACVLIAYLGSVHGATPTVIDTFAGGGSSQADGVPAIQASFFAPTGVAVDGAGNVYVVLPYDNIVRKINIATGLITTVAGTQGFAGFNGDGASATAPFTAPGGAALLNFPIDVAVDSAGNLYIADSGNNCVRMVDHITQFISTFAGTGTAGGPSAGDGGPANLATMNEPFSLAVSSATLFILDRSNHCVRGVDFGSGNISTIVGDGTNQAGFAGDGGAPTTALLNNPMGICVNPTNYTDGVPIFHAAGSVLYIADTLNSRIRIVDLTAGTINTYAGNGTSFHVNLNPGIATNATLYQPEGVGVDNNGNLYIAETLNNVIRMVDTSAVPQISTFAAGHGFGLSGDGGDPLNAQLSEPVDLAFDSTFSNLYIVDNFNGRVRVIGPSTLPTITSPSTAVGIEDAPFSYNIIANGSSNTTYASTPFVSESGLSLSGSAITGIPKIADIGTHVVTIMPTNAAGTGTPFMLSIMISARMPTITSATTAAGTDSSPFSFTLTTDSTDPADPITFSVSPLPPGFVLTQTSFNSATITGTPTASEVGLTNLTINAKSLSNSSATPTNLALTISAIPPTFTIPAVANGVQFVPFTFTLTAGGSPPTTFTATGLPAGLSLSGATITGVPTAIGSSIVTVKATNSGGSQMTNLRINIVQPTIPLSNSFTVTIDANQNPAETGTPVTFTATAGDPTAMFLWNFGDGTFLAGNPVQHAFTTEADYAVTVIGLNGLTSAAAELNFSALAPIVPGVPNISNGKAPVTNPLNGISITVSRSDGGVIELTIEPGQAGRAVLDAVTSFDDITGRSAVVQGFIPVHKFTQPGIYVATVALVDKVSGAAKGKMRKTLVVSTSETGVAVARELSPLLGKPPKLPKPKPTPKPIIPPPNLGDIRFGSMKGKFIFSANSPDSVEFVGTIQLPAGVDIKQPQSVSLSIGNVVDNFTVDANGKATSAGQFNRIKKFQIKYPKNADKTASNVAQFDALLQTPDMDSLGFDTEGVVKGTPAAPQRSIQLALLYAGTSYEFRASVAYAPSSSGDSATITGRSGK